MASINDDVALRVMDENVGANCEIGNCSIKLAAMCVEGGLENWWTIAHNGNVAGRIHLRGEWIAGGSDPVAFSASAMPGLQQTAQQQRTMTQSMHTGPKVNTYQMPAYNFQAPNKMTQPQWAERQYQNADAVHARGFMGQSRK